MKAEVIIYIYGGVCGSMILFNIFYNLLLKGSEPRMKRRIQKMEQLVAAQLRVLQATGQIEEKHRSCLRRKLRFTNWLIAFHYVVNERSDDPSSLLESYLQQIRPVILYLAMVYRDKAEDKAGYFTYFLFCYTQNRRQPVDSLQKILLDYMEKKNLYCRFNALKALYHLGSPEYIVKAMEIADDNTVFLHDKLITESLLTYTGDHKALIAHLWSRFLVFSPHMQLAILNYIRFCSGDYQKEMYEIMLQKDEDKELRIAAVRYFGKYFYPPAQEHLLSFLTDPDGTKWEFATVAAFSLAIYPGDEVVNALKQALHSANWYVRYSAAQSLERQNVDYSDMVDIAAGSDRYAREMMMYRLESRKLQDHRM